MISHLYKVHEYY